MPANKKTNKSATSETENLWRQPITLDSFGDEDPLEKLYRGREAADKSENAAPKIKPTAKKVSRKSARPDETIVAAAADKKTFEPVKFDESVAAETTNSDELPADADAPEAEQGSEPEKKMSDAQLKNILRIKSETFTFTDLREILRGKSYEIYSYLRFLAGDAGVCKIKHQDLMRKLDISRPTLFKQGDWLTRLSLIEKHNVPGDHLGTSYIVSRIEDVLPVSESLIKQMQNDVEKFAQLES